MVRSARRREESEYRTWLVAVGSRVQRSTARRFARIGVGAGSAQRMYHADMPHLGRKMKRSALCKLVRRIHESRSTRQQLLRRLEVTHRACHV